MEQTVLIEQKVALPPKMLNKVQDTPLDDLILGLLREKLEGKCNQHGFVIPNSLELLSRSMGQLDHGHYTGSINFYVQAQARVYNPANGTRVTGTILKKNKMGLYMIYNDAIRILVPRDLHLGNDAFETLEPGQDITIEVRKSRFQLNDTFILSIGVLVGTSGLPAPTETVTEAEAEAPLLALDEGLAEEAIATA